MDTKSIFDTVFNSTEREDFKESIKGLLLEHLRSDLESFAETEFCFSTGDLEEIITEAINESKEEVKNEIKPIIRARMMEKLDI